MSRLCLSSLLLAGLVAATASQHCMITKEHLLQSESWYGQMSTEI